MKIKTNPQALANTISGIALTGRTTLPSLHAVLLTADEMGCRAQTYNLDMLIEAPFEAEVKACGTCLVPAAKLAKVLASCPGEATLTAGDKLAIRAGGYSATMATFRGDEWDRLPAMGEDAEEVGCLYGSSFHFAIGLARAWAARANGRPQLEGVLIERGEGGELAFVGTSGTALTRIGIYGGGMGGDPMFLPLASATRIAPLLDTIMAGVLKVWRDGPWLWFINAGATIAVRMGDNNFPKYADLIGGKPATWQGNTYVGELLPLVRRAMLACGEDGTFRVDADVGGLTITASHRDVCSYEETLPITSDGKVSFGVKGELLLEAIPSSLSPSALAMSMCGNQLFLRVPEIAGETTIITSL